MISGFGKMVVLGYFAHVFGVGLHRTSTDSINAPTLYG